MKNSSEMLMGNPVMPGPPVDMNVGKPATPFDQVYVLSYIHKIKMNEKFFYSTLSLMDTVNRAKAHCEKMGFRFLFVRPFLSDFVEDERKHSASY